MFPNDYSLNMISAIYILYLTELMERVKVGAVENAYVRRYKENEHETYN
jgi:hypothetical protein